jgi:NADH-quinone oxidoreductase subunit A
MLSEYIAVLIYLVLAVVITVVVIFSNKLLGPSKPSIRKSTAYESGIVPTGNARERFNIRYHVIAMIFLIFDLEIAFIYPWAVIYRTLGWAGFIEMMIFLTILIVGFIYAWKRGAFSWE